MSDFDDYFDDDVVFDEQTLAALDREEKKYFTQDQAPPPAKRQKTNPATATNRFTSFNELDSLPDISLEFDGNYTALELSDRQPAQSTPAFANLPQNTRRSAPQTTGLNRHASPVPPVLPPSFGLSTRTNNGPLATSTPVNAPQNSRVNGSMGRGHRRPPISHRTTQGDASIMVDSGLSVNIAEELQQQLAQLKSKFEELSQENTKIQTALQESITARQAKEGEVTILRKGAERTAKVHADQIASLKAEREEAISSRIRLQRDMREEIERIKTELSFKHNEQESIRAALNSTRNRTTETPRKNRNLPTPLQVAGFPSVTQMGGGIPARKQTKNSFLPGFQNAFNSGPGQAPDPSSCGLPTTPSKGSKFRRHISQSQMNVDAPCFPSPAPQSTASFEDVHMKDGQQIIADEFNQLDLDDAVGLSPASEESQLEPVNPVAELLRITFTHMSPEVSHPTIHVLLQETAPIEANESRIDIYQMYSSSCDRLLGVLAISSTPEDFEYAVNSISHTLVTILPILRGWKSWSCLAAALDLLTTLLYALPNFGPTLLSTHNEESSHPMLVMVLELVGEKQEHVPEIVAAGVAAALEAFCFNADDRVVEKLTSIPHHWQNLVTLLNHDSSQTLWLKISRFLAVLASHRNLCRGILSMPETPTDPGSAQVPAKIPLIERLCLLLVENTRHSLESMEFKRLILAFFALLSTSQPDVHNHLLQSSSIIPAVILFLSQLTTPFWEDDEELLLADSADVLSRIRNINQTLFFLHYLIFSSASFLNLRQKLYIATHRVFYGLIHPFVVTFGRLTYGEAPDWIEERGRAELMALTDIARDILDHVLDGPEADRTWQTYTTDLREEDEEDMEAELLGHRAN